MAAAVPHMSAASYGQSQQQYLGTRMPSGPPSSAGYNYHDAPGTQYAYENPVFHQGGGVDAAYRGGGNMKQQQNPGMYQQTTAATEFPGSNNIAGTAPSVEPPDRQRGPIKSPWATWPCTRQEASQCEVPIGLLFTPFSEDQHIQMVSYEPVRSRHGGCILSPICTVDFRNKFWTDPFSLQRNALPPHYAQQLTETNLCAELISPSVEYKLNTPSQGPPSYMFVVDTSVYEEELEALKDSLQQILGLMPPDANVGLITYGTVVHVHELGFAECVKSHVFRGKKEITKDDLQNQLRIGVKPRLIGANQQAPIPTGATTQIVAKKFVCPLADCEFILNVILDDLQPDSWPVAADHRAARCTGAALSAGISLMELCCSQQPGRILLFSGGVCTAGPGQIVGTPLSESIRQHLDLQKESGNAKYVKKAIAYYSELSVRSVAAGHSIDLFFCALDQTGLHEMKVCAERTGGVVVMSDTFSMNVFRDSLRKLFETGPDGCVRNAFNVKIEVLSTKEVRICGAIGCCSSTNKKSSQVAELTVGQANTCEWAAGVMDKNSSIAVYMEISNTNEKALQGRSAFLQFQVTYTHPNGERRIRVITIGFPFANPSGPNGPAQLGSGFDQETATVLMARLAVSKTETEEPLDILRWLDRKLIRLVSLFADYHKDRPETFQLGAEFLLYPAFMYHLRRSHFLQTFNASPDETAYYRIILLRETLANSITMISPNLFEYNLTNLVPVPVELDSRALKSEVVLLLDSFFHLVVWHGEQIVRWKEAGYHEMEKFSNLKIVLEAPLADAKRILQSRLPCPKFVVCNAGGSQARFLLAKVNPSSTHSHLVQEFGADNVDGTSIITDDVSMKTFMEHLIKLATST